MIVVRVGEETYTISKDLSVSEGKYKKFLEACIRMAGFRYNIYDGDFSKYLYGYLHNFKSIELVSLDYTPSTRDIIH